MHAVRFLFVFLCSAWAVGCANIVPPSGGERDTQPPKLLGVSPTDSSLNVRPARVELRFDEYIQLGDLSALQISPLLPTPLTATANGKRIVVTIPDTSLQDATTYRIRFGAAIQDLHEGNPFGEYAYTFSTGSYFDSLQLVGQVLNAATGLPDGEVAVLLYSSNADDTAVLRGKPQYAAKTDGTGAYRIEGLPRKAFRIYAVGDKNNNLTADGGERVAFLDTLVFPSDTAMALPVLRTFEEGPDTALTTSRQSFRSGALSTSATGKAGAFAYAVQVDTADAKARIDLTEPLRITFSARVDELSQERIFLSYDSAGATLETAATAVLDTPDQKSATLSAAWQPDVAYTLRLLKGFARDTAGSDAGPARYRFRTKREEDYGKMQIHIPSRFYGRQFLLMVQNETDTVHAAPITDSTVRLVRLQPGTYSLRIIGDANGNGVWDAGALLLRRQPELVLPHSAPVPLKAGWEATVDFEADDPRRASRSKGEALRR